MTVRSIQIHANLYGFLNVKRFTRYTVENGDSRFFSLNIHQKLKAKKEAEKNLNDESGVHGVDRATTGGC